MAEVIDMFQEKVKRESIFNLEQAAKDVEHYADVVSRSVDNFHTYSVQQKQQLYSDLAEFNIMIVRELWRLGGMSISKLKEILDEIDYPVLVEIVDCLWCRDAGDYYFQWNKDNSVDDLENQDGNTYSTEGFEGISEYNDYLVVNGNNGCGQTITYFFNLSKEVKF